MSGSDQERLDHPTTEISPAAPESITPNVAGSMRTRDDETADPTPAPRPRGATLLLRESAEATRPGTASPESGADRAANPEADSTESHPALAQAPSPTNRPARRPAAAPRSSILARATDPRTEVLRDIPSAPGDGDVILDVTGGMLTPANIPLPSWASSEASIEVVHTSAARLSPPQRSADSIAFSVSVARSLPSGLVPAARVTLQEGTQTSVRWIWLRSEAVTRITLQITTLPAEVGPSAPVPIVIEVSNAGNAPTDIELSASSDGQVEVRFHEPLFSLAAGERRTARGGVRLRRVPDRPGSENLTITARTAGDSAVIIKRLRTLPHVEGTIERPTLGYEVLSAASGGEMSATHAIRAELRLSPDEVLSLDYRTHAANLHPVLLRSFSGIESRLTWKRERLRLSLGRQTSAWDALAGSGPSGEGVQVERVAEGLHAFSGTWTNGPAGGLNLRASAVLDDLDLSAFATELHSTPGLMPTGGIGATWRRSGGATLRGSLAYVPVAPGSNDESPSPAALISWGDPIGRIRLQTEARARGIGSNRGAQNAHISLTSDVLSSLSAHVNGEFLRTETDGHTATQRSSIAGGIRLGASDVGVALFGQAASQLSDVPTEEGPSSPFLTRGLMLRLNGRAGPVRFGVNAERDLSPTVGAEMMPLWRSGATVHWNWGVTSASMAAQAEWPRDAAVRVRSSVSLETSLADTEIEGRLSTGTNALGEHEASGWVGARRRIGPVRITLGAERPMGKDAPWEFALGLQREGFLGVGLPESFYAERIFVFEDANANGKREAGEAGVADVTLRRGRDRYTSDADGMLLLPRGADREDFMVDESSIPFALRPLPNQHGSSVALVRTARLSVRLFADTNRNGEEDDAPAKLLPAEAHVSPCASSLILRRIEVSESGEVAFSGLLPGCITIHITPKDGRTPAAVQEFTLRPGESAESRMPGPSAAKPIRMFKSGE